MEEELKPQFRVISQMRILRFGRIFSNISIACTILAVIAVMSSIIIPLFQGLIVIVTFFILILLVVFTLGLIFLIPNNPMSGIWGFLTGVVNSTDEIGRFSNFCISIIPHLSITGFALAIISISFLILSKKRFIFPRVLLMFCMCLILLILVIFYFITGGKLWQ